MIGEVRGLKKRGPAASPALRITGFGVQASRGIKGGVVVDVAEAEKAIRMAVDAAERSAGTEIEEVWVNISGGQPRCTTLSAEMDIKGGGPVGAHHLRQLTARAVASFDEGTREVVHVAPAAFHLDGGPATPVVAGMYADRLRARVNVISVDRGPLRNLEMVIERSMLRPAGFVIAPWAAARAVLTDDERELGAIVVEVGAANTSIAVVVEGRLEHAAMAPVGSQHITRDIAIGLRTPLSEAERLKTVSGSALPGMHDDLEEIRALMLGEEGPGGAQQLPRSMLGAIIRPRVEEILELARDEIEACKASAGIRQVVLTGGGSQLCGMREMAEKVLGRNVRIGMPREMAGLPRMMASPAHAGVAGLVRMAMSPDGQGFQLAGNELARAGAPDDGADGYFSRVKRWLGQSF